MMSYKEAIEEYGPEFAEAVLQEEYNEFISNIGQPAADFYLFDISDDYPGYVESIGARRVKKLDEIMYRMAEGV